MQSPVSQCPICFENNTIFGYGACQHFICYICAIRYRVLSEQPGCPICKTYLNTLLIGRIADKALLPHLETNAIHIQKYKIYASTKKVLEIVLDLLAFQCSTNGCNHTFQTLQALCMHKKKAHAMLSCHLCIQNKSLFAREVEYFNKQQLDKHIITGDKTFSGHPRCIFCTQAFYDTESLVKHSEQEHERCFICRKNGMHNHFFKNYDALEAHFKADHYFCDNAKCMEMKFMVFESEIEYRSHVIKSHPLVVGQMGGVKKMRTVPMFQQISYEEERRNRSNKEGNEERNERINDQRNDRINDRISDQRNDQRNERINDQRNERINDQRNERSNGRKNPTIENRQTPTNNAETNQKIPKQPLKPSSPTSEPPEPSYPTQSEAETRTQKVKDYINTNFAQIPKIKTNLTFISEIYFKKQITIADFIKTASNWPERYTDPFFAFFADNCFREDEKCMKEYVSKRERLAELFPRLEDIRKKGAGRVKQQEVEVVQGWGKPYVHEPTRDGKSNLEANAFVKERKSAFDDGGDDDSMRLLISSFDGMDRNVGVDVGASDIKKRKPKKVLYLA